MQAEPQTRRPDFADLEERIKVIAYASRLELLHQLRTPRTMDEIRLEPGSAQAGDRPERIVSRQAVQHHLRQLQEAGLVRVRDAERKDTTARKEYAVDPSALFALLELMRETTLADPRGAYDPAATMPIAQAQPPEVEPGPRLLLVHGARPGTIFPLRTQATRGGRGWVIGRDAKSHVALTYDPFVSSQNSEVVRTKDGFELVDLRTAKNGTFLNWRPLPVGSSARLATGDVVGVGRSLLVFRAA